MGSLEQTAPLREDPKRMSAATLAFLGDAVYELLVRRRLAVTTLDGQTVLPAQPGSLTTLETEGAVLLAVQGAGGGDWQLYDLDGTPLALLPGGADSWCQANGPLVEVLSPDCSAYYWPDTGECVFRAWLTLEDHGETEASLS